VRCKQRANKECYTAVAGRFFGFIPYLNFLCVERCSEYRRLDAKDQSWEEIDQLTDVNMIESIPKLKGSESPVNE